MSKEQLKSVRMQVMVPGETAAKIEELAELLQITPTQMAARLLKESVSSHELIIRWITVPADRVRRVLTGRRVKPVEGGER